MGPDGKAGFLEDAVLSRRLFMFNNKDIPALMEEYNAAQSEALEILALAGPRRSGQPQSSFTRAQRECRAGNWSTAAQPYDDAITRARPTPEVIQSMRDCFPQIPAVPLDHDHFSQFVSPSPHAVDQEDLIGVVAHMRRNRAGGASRMRSDFLQPTVLSNESVQSSLVTVVQRLVDGAMPTPVLNILNLCALHPLIQAGKDEPRPITCSEWLLQLMESYQFSTVREHVRTRLESVGQFGYGTRCGIEAILHGYQLVMAQFPEEFV